MLNLLRHSHNIGDYRTLSGVMPGYSSNRTAAVTLETLLTTRVVCPWPLRPLGKVDISGSEPV